MMATFQGDVLLTAFFFNNLTGRGRINYIHSTYGSFHVNSTNFWMFFHGPPRIVLKFGTVVEHGKKNLINFYFFYKSCSF